MKTTLALLAFVFIPVVAVASDPFGPGSVPMEQRGPQDAERIQGRWRLVKVVVGGQDITGTVQGALEYTFAAGHLIRGDLAPVSYRLNPAATPGAIDIMDPDGKCQRVVYRIDRDTLTMCGDATAIEKRPAGFDSPVGSDVWVTTYRRVRK